VTSPGGPRGAPLLGSLLAFSRDRLGFITAVAREHGDVARFRLGPHTVWLLSHPRHVHEALVIRHRSFRKSPVLQQARMVLGNGLLTSEGEEHRRQRRLVQPAFSASNVAGHEPAMTQAAVAEAQRWVPGTALDVHVAMHRATLAIAGSTLFGADTAQRAEEVREAVDDLLAAYPTLFWPLPAAVRRRLPLPPLRRLRRGIARLDDIVAELVAERRAAGSAHTRTDLLSRLLAARDDDGSTMADRQLRDEVVTLLLAGHETTAAALAWTLHLLATHPDAQDAVRTELTQSPPDADADPDIERLPLTRAAFAEALRLYPPSWGIARQAQEDVALTDAAVGRGELVLLSPWVVHRDARWWPHPERFDPGRWHDPATGRGAGAQEAWFPFGAGPRICVGERFAWVEAVAVLAAVIRRWRLRPVPGRPPLPAARITLRPADGVWLVPDPV
jgi:cytochrome P450